MRSNSENKYKIVICDLGRFFRGGQRQTFNLASALKKNGLQVIVLCRADGILSDWCRRKDIDVYRATYRPVFLLHDAFNIAAYLKKDKFEVFHASDSHSHTLGLFVKYFYQHIRLVVTARTCMGKTGFFSEVFKYGSTAVDSYIAISEAVAANLVDRGVKRARIEVIPSSIDREYFTSTGKTDKSVFTIGAACSLETGKGVDVILKALAQIRDKLDDFRFVVAGFGPQRSRFEQMAADLGLRDKVEFRGFVENMAEFYRDLNLYILASRSEGLGSSLLEAGACGAALIGARVGGIGEIIEDGKDGFLFEYGDLNSLSELILKVAMDIETREKIAKAIEKKLNLFDINTKIEDYLKLYRMVLEGR
jgi:glycosyltransferase involved in cell wall biosynthesis